MDGDHPPIRWEGDVDLIKLIDSCILESKEKKKKKKSDGKLGGKKKRKCDSAENACSSQNHDVSLDFTKATEVTDCANAMGSAMMERSSSVPISDDCGSAKSTDTTSKEDDGTTAGKLSRDTPPMDIIEIDDDEDDEEEIPPSTIFPSSEAESEVVKIEPLKSILDNVQTEDTEKNVNNEKQPPVGKSDDKNESGKVPTIINISDSESKDGKSCQQEADNTVNDDVTENTSKDIEMVKDCGKSDSESKDGKSYEQELKNTVNDDTIENISKDSDMENNDDCNKVSTMEATSIPEEPMELDENKDIIKPKSDLITEENMDVEEEDNDEGTHKSKEGCESITIDDSIELGEGEALNDLLTIETDKMNEQDTDDKNTDNIVGSYGTSEKVPVPVETKNESITQDTDKINAETDHESTSSAHINTDLDAEENKGTICSLSEKINIKVGDESVKIDDEIVRMGDESIKISSECSDSVANVPSSDIAVPKSLDKTDCDISLPLQTAEMSRSVDSAKEKEIVDESPKSVKSKIQGDNDSKDRSLNSNSDSSKSVDGDIDTKPEIKMDVSNVDEISNDSKDSVVDLKTVNTDTLKHCKRDDEKGMVKEEFEEDMKKNLFKSDKSDLPVSCITREDSELCDMKSGSSVKTEEDIDQGNILQKNEPNTTTDSDAKDIKSSSELPEGNNANCPTKLESASSIDSLSLKSETGFILDSCSDEMKQTVGKVIDQVWSSFHKASKKNKDIKKLGSQIQECKKKADEIEKVFSSAIAELDALGSLELSDDSGPEPMESEIDEFPYDTIDDEDEEDEEVDDKKEEQQQEEQQQQIDDEDDVEVVEPQAISSDSDDDVQFISTSFDPAKAEQEKKRQEEMQKQRLMQQQQQQQRQMQQMQQQGVRTMTPTQLINRMNQPGAIGVLGSGAVQIRAMPAQSANGQVQYQYMTGAASRGPAPTITTPARSQRPSPSQAPISQGQIMRRPTQTVVQAPPRVQPPKEIELVEGMKLFAKKHTDKWFKGTLVEILNKDQPKSEKRYKVKFDMKGQGVKVCTGKLIAYTDAPNEILPVGRRIIAQFREDEQIHYYAGIIAEPPSLRNNHRYLTFFDDGYAQYCTPKQLHKVCEQSKNVWDDVHPDSQEFIRGYLQQYPERPMVRLQKGQVVKTEWNGKWWIARVQEVDASLVKMYFEADRRIEWIYRGSTRLEPLYTELANQEASKLAGKGRRHNLVKSGKRHVVEYMTGRDDNESGGSKKPINVDSDGKRKPVAKKSTAMKKKEPSPEKKPVLEVEDDDSGSAERLESHQLLQSRNILRNKFVRHGCCKRCLSGVPDDPRILLGSNPLLIPLLCGWERQISKQRNTGRRVVFYRSPCGRRLRDTDEVDRYLQLTGSGMTPDLFCFDPILHTDTEYVPVKTFCDIKDLSYGKETVQISCVNGIDRQYPDYVEYSNQRIPAKGVKLNLEEEFLVGCDCTDGCRDRSKCACVQRTLEASRANTTKRTNYNAPYKHRRIQEHVITGIYECNSRCKCDCRCTNRVAQNGLSLRLQVFKTEKRGWGLRCLDDIPAGGFICIYAGQLLTEQGANEDGQQYGDEYLAELDYIEVIERNKEGYESDVNEDEGVGDSDMTDDDYKVEPEDTDSDYSGGKNIDRRRSRSTNRSRSTGNKKGSDKNVSEWLGKASKDKPPKGDAIVISDEEGSNQSQASNKSTRRQTSQEENGDGIAGLKITEPTSMHLDDDEEDNGSDSDEKSRKRRSARAKAQSLFSNLPDPKSQQSISPLKKPEDTKKKEKKSKADKEDKVAPLKSTRLYFESEEFCYVMDAKSMGNLGRYLNHSCSPNVFVQNVFVDTHDLRFPWVAFFASQFIRAGTELTWDYNYEVGSVPGKVLYCYCGSAECRGRLL